MLRAVSRACHRAASSRRLAHSSAGKDVVSGAPRPRAEYLADDAGAPPRAVEGVGVQMGTAFVMGAGVSMGFAFVGVAARLFG